MKKSEVLHMLKVCAEGGPTGMFHQLAGYMGKCYEQGDKDVLPVLEAMAVQDAYLKKYLNKAAG